MSWTSLESMCVCVMSQPGGSLCLECVCAACPDLGDDLEYSVWKVYVLEGLYAAWMNSSLPLSVMSISPKDNV